MAATMKIAVANGTGIGAHPGFPDLQGFGRRRMSVPNETLGNMVRYQLGAAQAMARAAGGEVRHLKLHGALANMASENVEMARACYEAALSVDPEIIVMVLAGTAQQQAAQELGCKTACEIFADRAYNNDATLVDRSLPGAVIHDPAEAGRRMVDMVREGAIITADGYAYSNADRYHLPAWRHADCPCDCAGCSQRAAGKRRQPCSIRRRKGLKHRQADRQGRSARFLNTFPSRLPQRAARGPKYRA